MNSNKLALLLVTIACAILCAGCPGKVASNNANCKPLCEVEAYDKVVKFPANESESWKVATSKITPGSVAQTRVRNLCEVVLAGEPTDCPAAMRTAAMTYTGGTAFPAFETDQVRVTRLTAGPDEAIEIAKSAKPPTIVVVDNIDGTVHMACGKTPDAPTVTLHAHSGDTFPGKSGEHCLLHNAGKAPVRFLAVEFR